MPQNFSWGIFMLFAWLVPHVSIEIGEYRRSLCQSFFWTHGGGDEKNGGGGCAGKSERFRGAVRVVRHAALASIIGSLVLISGTAAGVALTTQGLDPNMVNIIEGGSLFMAAVLTAILSIKSPMWIGVYCSRRRALFKPVGKNARALGFDVWWSVSRQFAKAYFCLLPFYCGAGAALIPISAVAGIAAGFVMDLGIYLGRHTVNDTNRGGWRRTYGMAFLLVVLSSSLFANGCYHVDTVWGLDRWARRYWALRLVSGSVWFVSFVLVHTLVWKKTSRRLEDDSVRGKYIPTEHAPGKLDRLATSLVRSAVFSRKEQRATKATVEAAEAAGVGVYCVQTMKSSMSIIVEENGPHPEEGRPVGEEEEKDRFNGETWVVDPSPIGGIDADKFVDDSGDPNIDEADPDPSWCSLVVGKICCRRSFPDHQAEMTKWGKIRTALMVIFWMCISGGFVFFVIINIGAQAQVASTNSLLPGVTAILYTGMDLGEVCAFDDRGPDSNIYTFPSREDAHAEGYKVLHCGACGYCSTWENLRLEWSTRNYLAAESARCAKKSLGGGREAVLECMQKEPLSFDYHCADCWTTDILCTRDHCAFIFLQSQFINKVGNFKVAPGEVTSATCEEAHCEVDPAPGELGFVRCSGATRRRMNIKSTIARPVSQQCTIVDVTWEDQFGPCCANTDEFYVDRAERARSGDNIFLPP